MNLVREIPSWFLAGITNVGVEPDDTADIRLEKSLLVGASILVAAAGVIWGIVFTLLHEPVSGSISLSYSAITLILLVRFSKTHRYRFFINSQLFLGLVLPFSETWALGGFAASGAVLLWAMISPVGALLLNGIRSAWRWWLSYIALIAAIGLAEPFLWSSNNLPPWFITALFVLNISAISLIAMFVLVYFVSQKNEAYRLLRIEEEKAENLLLNILPREIANILKNEKRTIADHFDGASILFADLVGFTTLTANMAPVEMVELLNHIFTEFDSLVEKYDLEKIRTIGDNYMVAAGVPRPRADHAQILACLALDMTAFIQTVPQTHGQKIEFRIGINSGPVVGGVIGRKKFVYDLWGDAVNVASRMESQGVPGKIQVTASTYELINDQFECEPRGRIAVKGRGEMSTWFLTGLVKPT